MSSWISDHESESDSISNENVYIYCNDENQSIYSSTTFKKIIEENIFRPELDQNGFSNSEVWIEFNNEAELESDDSTDETTTQTIDKKPIQKKGQDYTTRDTVAKQNTSGTDKKGGQVGGNGNTNK